MKANIKKLLVPVVLVGLVVVLCPSRHASADDPPGLVAYWPLDTTTDTAVVEDATANSNDGVLMYAASITGEPAPCTGAGASLSLDGIAGHVWVSDSASLNPDGSMTISAWFKTSETDGGMIVNKDGVNPLSTRQYDIHINVDGGLAANFWSPIRAHVNTKEIGIPTDYNDGQWHHVAATFFAPGDGGDGLVRLYVDGSLVGTSAENVPPEAISSVQTTMEDVWIGNRRYSPLPFDGLIDEVRIYNEALSPEEIVALVCSTCAEPPNNLVSWWPGDGDAYDIKDGNNGTLVNEATFADGKVGKAFSLDGVNDYVEIPDSDSLDTGTQFTIDAWFNTDNVDKIDPGTKSKTQTIVMYGFDPANGKNNPLSISDGKLSFVIRGYGPGFEDLLGETSVNNNTWYHATVTYDGTTAKLYLNGVLEDSELSSMNMNTNSRVTIGRYQNPAYFNINFHFDGLIDEVEIFGRALSQEEIQTIVYAGPAGKCKVIEVKIDIKPGSDPNSINLSSAGVIPVAILSTSDFNAPEEVDPATVSLAGAEIKVAGKSGKYLSHEEDVNDDGLLDLVCQVLITEDWAIELGETSVVLEAQTYDGQSIRGEDAIRIVPDK